MNIFSFRAISALVFTCAIADAQTVLNLTPSRVLGQNQLQVKSQSPNLIEGRELWNPWAITVDTTTSPSPLYVSDTANNRILAWRNAQSFNNGAVADLVIGQPDKQTTFPINAATGNRRYGMSAPGGLAVDKSGNLYVVDTGNNRILRFPKPFSATDDPRNPDFVLGQPSFTSSTANAGGISAISIATASTTTAGRTGLAFDGDGNLWFTDSLNNRVLRYPASSLTAGSANRPSADIVLGQAGFTTNTATGSARLRKDVLRNPGAVAIDSSNRVFVADAFARVLVYEGPFANGKEASRIAGIPLGSTTQTQQVASEFSIGQAEGIFIANDRLGVVDTLYNRINVYDTYVNWAPESQAQFSPRAQAVIGQPSFASNTRNKGQSEASADSLAAPLSAFYNGSELFVADSGNNRVLVFPGLQTNSIATRLLGQVDYPFFAPNLTEGRELFIYSANASELAEGGGLAIDGRATPRLYIADTFNNRILGYADARRVRPGDKADIVLGQVDFTRILTNSPSNSSTPNAGGLFRPIGLAVDRNGDLFVADAGNARVLRFPSPFDNYAAGQALAPNLVLGQANFTARVTDATARTMAYPYGIALTAEGHLVVSDTLMNRVLYFQRPAGADFVSGAAADKVIGQQDFVTVVKGTTTSGNFNAPGHLTLDSDDRLYVADSNSNRIMVYDRVTVAPSNPSAAFVLTGVGAPQGVYASPATGEIWVADTRGNRALRFPRFDQLGINPASTYTIPSNAPLALTQDALGNLYVAEAVNRIAVFYNGLATQVAGNFLSRPLSPGGIAIIYPKGDRARFGTDTAAASSVPLPTTLADVQVLLNDQPVPLYFVSPGQINFLVPMSAPEGGTVEYQVAQASTGQVLAAGIVEAQRNSPALFVQGGFQQGNIAALNEDNTVNSPQNPIARGRVIQMYATGQGRVPNAPPDGTPATGPINTADKPRVIIGTGYVDDSNVQYSGLAPGLVGVWQINVKVPDNAPTGLATVVVQLGSQFSNGAGVLPNNGRLATNISVK